MRLQDIPKAVKEGDWECMYSLQGLVNFIEELRHSKDYDKCLEMETDFQRGHV